MPRRKATATADAAADATVKSAAPVSAGKPVASIVTWKDADERKLAFASYYDELAKDDGMRRPLVRRQSAQASSAFRDIGGAGRSIRDGFDRRDYEDARSEDEIPKSYKGVMKAAIDAYEGIGIIRNTFDLSADLCVQGLDLVHPNKSQEDFYREWFRRVNGVERSNAFVTILLVAGQVPVKRSFAKLSAGDERDFKRTRSVAGADIEVPQPVKPGRKEIPLQYTFLNPLSVSLANEAVATFLGEDQFQFYLDIPSEVIKVVRRPRTPLDSEFKAALPQDIVQRIEKGGNSIPLRKDRVSCHYYKRPDWQPWAWSPIKAILPDLQILKKMKLADLAALDGAVSSIRVWKLGSLEHQLIPPPAVLQRLSAMLADNVGGGVMDLVWGPDITLEETSTEVYRFLGAEKYVPVLNAIFQGLGIPPSLYGSGQGGQQGYTNNSISMRTFTERLAYARGVLARFWEAEIRIVQAAMGFDKPASVVFDSLFTDQSSERQLYIDMWDRDIISDETLQEYFGASPEIEEMRLKKQLRRRRKGTVAPKASPFHDANNDASMRKILGQTGAYSAKELGVNLQDPKDDDPPNVRSAKTAKKYPAPVAKTPGAPGTNPDKKPKGQPGEGRPKNKKDKVKRKQKVVKPRGTAEFLRHVATATASLAEIARVTTPIYLQHLGKKTGREFTETEAADFEAFKFALLCQFGPGAPVTEATIHAALQQPLPVPAAASVLLQATVDEHVAREQSPPRVEVLRQYQALAAAVCVLDPDPAGEAEAENCGVSTEATQNPEGA